MSFSLLQSADPIFATCRTPFPPHVSGMHSFDSTLEILCGKSDYYPGLIPLILAYLESIDCDRETFEQMRVYLDFIRRRASGELQTAATWMRSIIASHPDYHHDSIVPMEVAHDLLKACILFLHPDTSFSHMSHTPFPHISEFNSFIIFKACMDVSDGQRHEPRLLGDQRIPPLRVDDAYYVPLKRIRVHRRERDALLQRYQDRGKG